MKHFPFFVSHALFRLGGRIGSLTWVWVTVSASLLAFSGILWVQNSQTRFISHFANEEKLLCQAQGDMAKGYVHVSLGGLPGSPFDRAQGLALLGQVSSSLERALRLQQEFGAELPPGAGESLPGQLAVFAQNVERFRGLLENRLSAPDSKVTQGTELRISYSALERQADAVESRIQQELSRTMRRYDRYRATITWGAGILLTIICASALVTDRARKRAEERRREAETAIRESERKYRELVQNANSAIIRWKRDGSIVFFNEYARSFFGYEEEEVIGKHVGLLVPDRETSGADRTALVEDVARHPDRYVHHVNENICRDGRRTWVAWTNNPLFDEKGEVMEILSVGTDTTERKLAEDRVREQNAILEAINLVFLESMACDTEERLGALILRVAGELTNSGFGFLAETGPDGLLHCIAVSDPGPEPHYGTPGDAERPGPGSAFQPHGPYERVLLSGRGHFINGPAPRPGADPAPPDLPPLDAFLGVPLIRDGRTIGMLAQGGREQGYTAAALDALEMVAPAVVQVILRYRAEKWLKQSLAEKEVLLREVHHRVKNNMQIIASLLGLQTSRSDNQQVVDVLRDTRNRVKSMALLHEALYRSGTLGQIDFASYLRDLCGQILQSCGPMADRVRMEYRVAPIQLTLEQAIPCGLIVNELVSNVFKHAFPDGRLGKVTVELEPGDGQMPRLKIRDNGVGLPEGLDAENTASLGLRLVFRLALQLRGQVTVERPADGGTAFHVVFPLHADAAYVPEA